MSGGHLLEYSKTVIFTHICLHHQHASNAIDRRHTRIMSEHSNHNLADSVALELLGTKWKPRIIVTVSETGAIGFGSLQSRLDNISNKVLSNNLDDLVERDVLNKEVLQESPRRVEFTLTPAGEDLYTIIEATADWDDQYVEGYGLPRVLIVDNDPRQVELLNAWLSTEYDVVTATDGESARTALDDTIQAAILNRHLPDTTGEAIIEEARAVGISPPTAFLSAVDVSVSAAELPADLLLTKPTTQEELLGAVKLLDRMNDFSDLRRKIRAREHRLKYVRETQGPAVKTTAEYEQAEVTLEEMRDEWQDQLEQDEAWRKFSNADSIEELLGQVPSAPDD
ncbi:MAG: putative transcriptional regulator [uncultured archaeon A07HR60]|nr:MAG: putative transcriptional regulator [uncultured archaeon A07HR60]